jgi:hypothetical protein
MGVGAIVSGVALWVIYQQLMPTPPDWIDMLKDGIVTARLNLTQIVLIVLGISVAAIGVTTWRPHAPPDMAPPVSIAAPPPLAPSQPAQPQAAAQSSPSATVTPDPQPPHRYRSDQQKGEIANGLERFRASLQSMKKQLQTHTQKTSTAMFKILVPSLGFSVRYNISDESISMALDELQDYSSFLNSIENGPTDVKFLSEPNYSKEAEFLIQPQKYHQEYSNLLGAVSRFLTVIRNAEKILGSSNNRDPGSVIIYLQEANVGPFTVSLAKPLEEWITGATERADLMEAELISPPAAHPPIPAPSNTPEKN